jgi:Leucine-rich repeat (LRR) protein
MPLVDAVNAWSAGAIARVNQRGSDPEARARAENRASLITSAAAAILEADARQHPTLELSHVPAPDLPEALGRLTQLTMLSIASSAVTALPESIGNLQRLERLQLASLRQLTTLPAGVSRLGALKWLVAMRTPLQSLPSDIDALRNLREIWLSGGTYAKLPDSIVNLRALATLSVEEPASAEGSLTRLPHRLGALGSLTTLRIKGHARLPALPESINQLGNLTTLRVENCPLVMLPRALNGLQALQTLSLSGCDKLARLPDSLTSIGGLRILGLSGCAGLTSLPQAIGQLYNLQLLDLSGCTSLAVLPSSLSELPGDCRIKVPEHLKAQLQALRPPAAPTRRSRRHPEPSAASSSQPRWESRRVPPRDSHQRARPAPPR